MSYMPLFHSNPSVSEGKFKQEGGDTFNDQERDESISEMKVMIDECFGENKEHITLEDFNNI
jgi:hypothetical protein